MSPRKAKEAQDDQVSHEEGAQDGQDGAQDRQMIDSSHKRVSRETAQKCLDSSRRRVNRETEPKMCLDCSRRGVVRKTEPRHVLTAATEISSGKPL